MDNTEDVMGRWAGSHVTPWRDTVFVKRLRAKGMDDEQVAVVVETIEEVCNECWDTVGACWCSADD